MMGGNDLLQLALLISLLQVDPEAYLGFNPYSSAEPGDDVYGQTWAQTQSQDPWLGLRGNPRIHPKSMASVLERFQEDILDDLNNLGWYSRISAYDGMPVHISAYVLDTDHGPQCQDRNEDCDSDSGISDTDAQENHDQESDSEKEKEKKEEAEDETSLDSELKLVSDPVDVFGLDSVMGMTPPPDENLQDLADSARHLEFTAGTDALEAELFHIDDQLMNIDDDLGHIDEAFMMMDEQLAVHISQDDDMMMNSNVIEVGQENSMGMTVDEQLAVQISTEDDGYMEGIGDEQDVLDEFMEAIDEEGAVGGFSDDFEDLENIFQQNLDTNPFDDWEKEAHSNFEELFKTEELNLEMEAFLKNAEPVLEDKLDVKKDSEENQNEDSDYIFNDPDLFPTSDSLPSSATLEDFDEDLLGGARIGKSALTNDIEKQLKKDAKMPQMSEMTLLSASNASEPFNPLDGSHEEFDFIDIEGIKAEPIKDEEVDFSADNETELLDELNVINESSIDETDEDIIMKVLRESAIDLKEEEIVDVVEEDILDVGSPFDLGLAIGGANSKAGVIDFTNLHENIKAEFKEEGEDGTAIAEFTLSPHLSLAYQPQFNERAFHNDHGGYSAPPGSDIFEKELSSGRKRNVSESSGYSSSQGGASSSADAAEDARKSRDDRLAKKMGLPFDVSDIVNLPVEQFTDLVARYRLNEKQLQLCRDIRRRGKNKVAAQNCRKRKMDQIEELQTQVESTRRRKERLLREREQLEQERARWSNKLLHMEQNVLKGLGRNIGQFRLEIDSGTVRVTAQLTEQATALLDTGSSPRSTRTRRSRD